MTGHAGVSVSMCGTLNRIDQVALRKVFSKHVVLRALLVSLVVGSILNVINQGDAMMDGRPIDIVKLLLTYAVPYFVASYGAYSAFRRLEILNEPDR